LRHNVHSMTASRTALLAVVCAALVAVPALAAGHPTIVATPNPVRPGHTVTIHGVVPGCPKGDQLTLISQAFSHHHDFAGLPAIFATIHAHSAYSVTTRIPSTKARGPYSISGRCGGGNIGVTRVLNVH
jgi:hypothetical protein